MAKMTVGAGGIEIIQGYPSRQERRTQPRIVLRCDSPRGSDYEP